MYSTAVYNVTNTHVTQRVPTQLSPSVSSRLYLLSGEYVLQSCECLPTKKRRIKDRHLLLNHFDLLITNIQKVFIELSIVNPSKPRNVEHPANSISDKHQHYVLFCSDLFIIRGFAYLCDVLCVQLFGNLFIVDAQDYRCGVMGIYGICPCNIYRYSIYQLISYTRCIIISNNKLEVECVQGQVMMVLPQNRDQSLESETFYQQIYPLIK